MKSTLRYFLFGKVNPYSCLEFSTYQILLTLLLGFFTINLLYQILAIFLEPDPFTPNYFVTIVTMVISLYLIFILGKTGKITTITYLFILLFAIEQSCDVLFDNPNAMLPNMLWFLTVIASFSITKSLPIIGIGGITCSSFIYLVWMGLISTQSIQIWQQQREIRSINGLYFSCFILSVGISSAIVVRNFLISQEKIHFAATRDNLTQLLNRNSLEKNLVELFEDYQNKKSEFTLIFADLDHFKQINDLLGHNLGDQVLREVGKRIQTACRFCEVPAGFDITPYRHGGDEFVLIISSIPNNSWFNTFLTELSDLIEQPYTLKPGFHAEVKISFGLAFSNQNAQSAIELLHYADIAMYAAKRSGKTLVEHSQQGYDKLWIRQFDIFHHLQNCIINNELSLLFQPVYSVQSLQLVKLEVLLRWYSASLGTVSPSEFIPIAETSSMISIITLWVIEECHRQVTTWFAHRPDICVAINLSPFVLQGYFFMEQLREKLSVLNCDPSRFTFEITETSPILNNTQVDKAIMAMGKMGFKFSLDDFGCGNSSFLTLKNGLFSEIKLDRSLVVDTLTSVSTSVIVAATISSAHAMGISVVAEGIETPELMERMRELNCDYLQGYYLDRPKPIQELAVP